MSIAHIRAYLARIDRLRRTSGSSTEEIVREAFKGLLSDWADGMDMVLIAEQPLATGRGKGRKPDATIRHSIRVAHGYWEAKDEGDDLDAEIETKRTLGYPTTNTIFEDTREAVLWQHGAEVMRRDMTDPDALHELVAAFFAYEPPVIEDWRVAVRQFQHDLPEILHELRERIDAAYAEAEDFQTAARAFLAHVQKTVNPALAEPDVREMLIQHILTEEIFTSVFSNAEFHRENAIAQQLYALERLFLRGSAKQEMLRALDPYYTAIKRAAVEIDVHHEKQTFLKVIYEGFYKTYNPKAADRLGVIYTPNEIVRFMVRGADWLCREHFGRGLADQGVEILDPATGTGTFVCEILEFLRGQPEIRRKYKEEIHANEVAILPYYVANLNVEATFAEITGQFAEYENLVFADTLDMTEGLGVKRGETPDLFGSISDENAERYDRQNRRRISVVIGNPPYNANQQNENDNNKNRTYKRIDERVKDTFVRRSTAQKTKVYDMYARFYRWAFDRLSGEGVVAFVTNRSFLDSRTFDGFRDYVGERFGDIYVVDLGGDVRANPKLSGTTHNVFGIQTGVSIAFFVAGGRGGGIRYVRRPEGETAKEKLDWLAAHPMERMGFEGIVPSKRGNWIDQVEHEWDDLIPLADKKVKAAKARGQDRAVFKLFSLGVVTARDEWVTDYSGECLHERLLKFSESYNGSFTQRPPWDDSDSQLKIKWTRALKGNWKKRKPLSNLPGPIIEHLYRPFIEKHLCFDPMLNEMQYQLQRVFPDGASNDALLIAGHPASKPFQVFTTRSVYSYDALEKTTSLPRYRYTPSGERIENVTDWALNKFAARYGKRAVSKDAIFAYCYAALHDPVWRERYAINLRREFPRIPFHEDFALWAGWGETLLRLHAGYEAEEPWPLERIDTPDEGRGAAGLEPKPVLKSDPEAGTVTLDSETVLRGVPAEAWGYRLGNRTAIDWVLDQHKEKKVRDATVEAWLEANPGCRYRFADHKERVAALLGRVVRVSVETVRIVEAMRGASEAA